MNSRRRKRYCPDLAGHMAECDCNYVRLVKLFPGMAASDQKEIGICFGDGDDTQVRIRVDERFKYTTTVTILLEGDRCAEMIRWPSIQVRLYHDMRTAEVMEYEQHRRFEPRYDYPNTRMYHPNEKVQVNQFLGELLSHCLAHGHSLEPVALGAELLN